VSVVDLKQEQRPNASIWALLQDVTDPEIPVLTLEDLGVIRDVQVARENGEDRVTVVITPTYSGCPAMTTMEIDIRDRLMRAGYGAVSVRTVLSPAWTTDWLTERGRDKLRAYGIAPPDEAAGKRALMGDDPTIVCPHCGSKDTRQISEFGSTACKALHQCNACLEPFDYFKCI